MDKILSILLGAAVLATPIIFTILNVMKLLKKSKSLVFEIIAFKTGIIFFMLAYALLEPVYYKDALFSNNGPLLHEAFNRYHIPTILVIWLLGLVFYFILKYYKKQFPPLTEAVLLAGVMLSLMVAILALVQLLAAFTADYVYVIIVLYMYVFIGNYIGLVINLLLSVLKRKAKEQSNRSYKNKLLNTCNRWLLRGSNLMLGGVLLMIPLLILLVLLLTIFGQEPDSAIKAFTETSDWILSTKISPPPIEYEGHYLCTVSLRGHRRLVKPIRYGIRHGKRIVVNRQLCVANAFEQLIMDKAPGLHKRIRSFYDSYGYPISKHIKKAWVADMVYLLMKPLEWIFLIVLYTFDKKPEDRIMKQYLPMR